jgi:hypothetical protein
MRKCTCGKDITHKGSSQCLECKCAFMRDWRNKKKIEKICVCGETFKVNKRSAFCYCQECRKIKLALGSIFNPKSQGHHVREKHDINTTFLMVLWHQQRGLCARTRMLMSLKEGCLKRVSIDRINNHIDYTKDNVQLVCKWYNHAKNNRTDEEILGILDEYKTQKKINTQFEPVGVAGHHEDHTYREWRKNNYTEKNCRCGRKLTAIKKKFCDQCNLSRNVLRDILKSGTRRHRDEKIDINFIVNLWNQQRGLCARTKMPMSLRKNCLRKVSVDRIDNSLSHTKTNIQLVCLWYNYAKTHHTDHETIEALENYKII